MDLFNSVEHRLKVRVHYTLTGVCNDIPSWVCIIICVTAVVSTLDQLLFVRLDIMVIDISKVDLSSDFRILPL